ncbi:YfhD family protein [Domibacillus epiphyticus]|uniref:YfhD family protein n=1 Tax=Domibacillus epiphyticus TaxID=1714355 RepID=A0A1V2A7V2_9BACI|nr:YfhD family protein [Domibacillus epiphyticus]OMP67027.1 hypothetical protein BTO28_08520 [Domibacillus epiphyticus]
MGRDDNKTGTRNAGSLPQTPKNLKIPPGGVNEEFSRELSELDNMEPNRERIYPNDESKK